MKQFFGFALLFFLKLSVVVAQQPETLFPVQGFAIAAPRPKDLDRFIKFIHDDLATRHVNTLILRVDYNYQYTSHPELKDSIALSKAEVKKLVDACKRDKIRIIPQINLLGHQSWAATTLNLLNKYPELDETPWVKMPAKYQWPNDDGLYCKSYCPLHPSVHPIVFAIVDELCDAFESTAFHAGMDEVFYIGDDKCPRCGGRDKAEIFANEVRTINDHLALRKRELWMWGDRLIDGKTTGMGMWEASFNNTWRAVDMIPKDVVICDWHYERPDQTAVYFAMKGLRVVTCPWNRSPVAIKQVEDMQKFRSYATPEMKDKFYGMVETVWSGPDAFLNGFYNVGDSPSSTPPKESNAPWDTFRAMYKKIDELALPKK